MKTLLFASIVIFFTSCGKIEIDLSGLDDINWGNWGYFPIRDSSEIVKADIDSSGKVFHLSRAAYNTYFSRFSQGTSSDTSIVISSYSYEGDIKLQIDLLNIINPGIYKFGKNASFNQDIKAECSIGGRYFVNDPNVLYGTLTIDSLTTNKIQGSFNVKCWNGANSINITNGIFVGKFY